MKLTVLTKIQSLFLNKFFFVGYKPLVNFQGSEKVDLTNSSVFLLLLQRRIFRGTYSAIPYDVP